MNNNTLTGRVKPQGNVGYTFDQNAYSLSGVDPHGGAPADRHQYLDLENAEPYLGVPPQNDYVLVSKSDGTRLWLTYSPKTITVSDNLANADFYPVFVSETIDDAQAPLNISQNSLSFNPATGVLSTNVLIASETVQGTLVTNSQPNIQQVGTINSGTWQANVIAVEYGGTGLDSLDENSVILGNANSTVKSVSPGTPGNVLLSEGGTWVSGIIGTSAPVADAIVRFDANSDITANNFIANGKFIGELEKTLSFGAFITPVGASTFNNLTDVTITLDTATNNVANTIVVRNSSGDIVVNDFSAEGDGDITGDLIVRGSLEVLGNAFSISVGDIDQAGSFFTLANTNTDNSEPYIGLKARTTESGTDPFWVWDKNNAAWRSTRSSDRVNFTSANILYDTAFGDVDAGTVEFDSLTDGTISITAIINDDTMTTAGDDSIATSDSIKTYVDNSIDGLGSISTQQSDNVSIQGGTIANVTMSNIVMDASVGPNQISAKISNSEITGSTFTGGSIENSSVGISSPLGGRFTTLVFDTALNDTNGNSITSITADFSNVSGMAVGGDTLATAESIRQYVDDELGTLGEQDSDNVNITGGSVSNVTATNVTVTSSTVQDGDITNVIITGSSVDSTPVGATAPSTGDFTTLQADNFTDGTVTITNFRNDFGTITGVETGGNTFATAESIKAYIDANESDSTLRESDNVTITGGVLDNVEIGQNTANVGRFTDLEFTSTFGKAEGININDILDQDDFSSNSDVALATQQSIKVYVDTSIENIAELSVAGDTGTTQISLSSDTITFAGGNNITTNVNAATDTVRFDLDSDITVNSISSAGITDTGTAALNDVLISGNLTVNGTTTTVNTETLEVADNIVVLNSNLPANVNPSQNAGIEINRGSSTNVTLIYDEANNRWSVGDQTFQAQTFLGNVTGQVSDISNHTTTDLVEGTNLYFTVDRVRSNISVSDTGGDGSLSYSNASGVITYTGPDQTEANARVANASQQVRAHISVTDTGGDGGLSYSNTTGVITYSGPNQTEANARVANASQQVRQHISNSTGISYITATGEIATIDSEIVHDDLSGFVPDEHVDHSTVEIIAGDGLAGGGNILASRTLSVGAGLGISVGISNIAVNMDDFSTTDLQEGANLYYTVSRANTAIDNRVTKTFVDSLNVDSDTVDGIQASSFARKDQSLETFTGSIKVSNDNSSGGGIILSDDGDIVDLNDSYCTFRFTGGIRVNSAKSGGSVSHTLASSGALTSTGTISGGNFSTAGAIGFGSTTRQMVNLFGTTYGIGVQSGTMYCRSAGRFSWFRGGSHNDAENNPGGGTVAMTLDSSSNLTVSGEVTAFSDERIKTNWKMLPSDFVSKLSTVKSGVYTRTDLGTVQVGVSAQSLRQVMPEAVHTTDDDLGLLTVSYGQAAMASAVELAKEVTRLNQRIEHLEELIGQLIKSNDA